MLEVEQISSETWTGARPNGFGNSVSFVETQTPQTSCPVSDWESIWSNCRRQIQRWRIPPHWSRTDWLEEMHAEGAIAALRANIDYDPSTEVPFRFYVARRVMGQAITRYRKEWSYARFRSDPGIDDLDSKATVDKDPGSSVEVHFALSNLRDTDRHLLERLFWNEETEAEVAQSLGISQQAVSKRKLSVLRTLQRVLGNRSK